MFPLILAKVWALAWLWLWWPPFWELPKRRRHYQGSLTSVLGARSALGFLYCISTGLICAISPSHFQCPQLDDLPVLFYPEPNSFFFFFSSTSLLLPTHLPPPSCTRAQSPNPMNFSPPDSSVHGFFQARILEWVAISFSTWAQFFYSPASVPSYHSTYFMPSSKYFNCYQLIFLFSHFPLANGLSCKCISVFSTSGEENSYKDTCRWEVSSLFLAFYYT